ncbi:uncharacterized protein N0V89_003535 [Didymosphaeria variabile]|uniref:Uncharacterized protein n=1 Tax=Didymosphaeria variabile TaxID=1932322 RepID=A0A9W8XQH1_9PLEO|nr:uncharacterized protein N0V89_003535 [Didymosphaeria variabile]KAJ4355518.1 hypothetical protein N0V89_003535 [Didymosphaeria variabile]
MAQPSHESGPGPSLLALSKILQRSYFKACVELDEDIEELWDRQTVLKQSFWALNAKYGKLDDDTTKEILALRIQLVKADHGQNTATHATAAEDQELHKLYEKALSELKVRELRRLKERYRHEHASEGFEEKHQRELGVLYEQWADDLDQHIKRLLHEHATAIRSNEQSARNSEREACEKAQLEMLSNLKNYHALEVATLEQTARANERKACDEKHHAAIDRLKGWLTTEGETREQAARTQEREICEKERDATIVQLKKKHATEIEAREQSARTKERNVSEEERSAIIIQLKKQHETELSTCRSENIAALSHNNKAYEAKVLELKTEKAKSLRDRNDKNSMVQHQQDEKKLWQKRIDELEREHDQEIANLRKKYERKVTDLEAEVRQLQKDENRVQKLLNQAEEYKSKSTAVQKSYDRALESLQSARTEIERRIGLCQDSETKNKALEQHHSQVLSQLDAKHSAGTLHLREEAKALRSELQSLRLKLAYNVQHVEDLKANEGVLWEKLSIQTAENFSLKVQSDKVEKERARNDGALTLLQFKHDARFEQALQENSGAFAPLPSQQGEETNQEEHEQIGDDQLISQESTVDGLKEDLAEAQNQIDELTSLLSDSQAKINTLQEQQDVLLQHQLRNWVTETTMAQTRPNPPEPSHEGTIPVTVRLPLDTDEAKSHEQVLQQIIADCETLEEECQGDEAALGTSKAELRKLNAELKALEKEHVDEFSWKAAKKKPVEKSVNE